MLKHSLSFWFLGSWDVVCGYVHTCLFLCSCAFHIRLNLRVTLNRSDFFFQFFDLSAVKNWCGYTFHSSISCSFMFFEAILLDVYIFNCVFLWFIPFNSIKCLSPPLDFSDSTSGHSVYTLSMSVCCYLAPVFPLCWRRAFPTCSMYGLSLKFSLECLLLFPVTDDMCDNDKPYLHQAQLHFNDTMKF